MVSPFPGFRREDLHLDNSGASMSTGGTGTSSCFFFSVRAAAENQDDLVMAAVESQAVVDDPRGEVRQRGERHALPDGDVDDMEGEKVVSVDIAGEQKHPVAGSADVGAGREGEPEGWVQRRSAVVVDVEEDVLGRAISKHIVAEKTHLIVLFHRIEHPGFLELCKFNSINGG